MSFLPFVRLTPPSIPSVPQLVAVLDEVGGQLPERSAFPLSLLGLVVGFVLLQNRLDRRDPKLAMGTSQLPPALAFRPPPSKTRPES